jgi:DNA-binding transcriptional MocR family regulator
MHLRIWSTVTHACPAAAQSAHTRKGPPHAVFTSPSTQTPAGVQQPAHERRGHGS